jgi:hypothetical protein
MTRFPGPVVENQSFCDDAEVELRTSDRAFGPDFFACAYQATTTLNSVGQPILLLTIANTRIPYASGILPPNEIDT